MASIGAIVGASKQKQLKEFVKPELKPVSPRSNQKQQIGRLSSTRKVNLSERIKDIKKEDMKHTSKVPLGPKYLKAETPRKHMRKRRANPKANPHREKYLEESGRKRAAAQRQNEKHGGAKQYPANHNKPKEKKWGYEQKLDRLEDSKNAQQALKQRLETKRQSNNPSSPTSTSSPEIAKNGRKLVRQNKEGAVFGEPNKKREAARKLEKTRALKWPQGSEEADGMLDQISKTSGDMYSNFKSGVETQYGGNYAKALGGAALKGGVWGGAIGGVTSSAQGGDFWEGAKQGAFTGALGGAAIRTAKLGTSADSIRDIYGNGKAIWGQYSKPVKALETNARNLSIMDK